MKKFTFLLILLFSYFSTYTQVDSLLKVLKSTASDTLKVRAYDDIFYEVVYQNLDLAKSYADSMLQFAKEVNHSEGIVLAHINNASYYLFTGDLQESLSRYKVAYQLALDYDFIKGQKSALANMANVEMALGDFESSESNMLLSRKLTLSLKDTLGLVKSYINVGSLKSSVGNYEEAIINLIKADSLISEFNPDDIRMFSYIKSNLGANYDELDDNEKAKRYYREGIDLMQKTNNREIITPLTNLSRIYIEESNLDSALHYMDKINKDLMSEVNKQYYYSNISDIKKELEQLDSSIFYIELALHQAQNTGMKIEEAVSFAKLSEIHLMQRNFERSRKFSKKALLLYRQLEIDGSSAFRNLFRNYLMAQSKLGNNISPEEFFEYQILNDSILGSEKIIRLSEMESKYENEKKQLQIANLEKENLFQEEKIGRQKAIILVYILGLILLAALTFFIFLRYRDKQKVNQVLKDKNKKISTLNREIIHRVKNQLNLATSILSIQKKRAKKSGYKDLLEDSEYKLKTLSYVNKKLDNDENLKEADLNETLSEILEGIVFSLGEIKGKPISCHIDLPEIKIPYHKLSYLGLIVNELAVNSVKHAFRDTKDPTIKLKGHVNGNLILNYSDNGEGFEREKDKNMGRQLIDDLVNQLRAEMDIKNTKGLDIEINIPISN